MRLVCMSDIHGGHRRLEVPSGDVAIFAGDLAKQGTLESLREFDEFLGTLPHSAILVVAGNHDVCFEGSPARARDILSNAVYLEDEAVEFEGVWFYGSPWQPRLVASETSLFAFDLPRGEPLAEKWRRIPDDVDVLVTHAPPKEIRDRIYTGEALGCRELRNRLEEVDPSVHIFGHVHEQPGVTRADSRVYVNASCPGGYGSVSVVELDGDGECTVIETGDWLPDWIRARMERKAANYKSS